MKRTAVIPRQPGILIFHGRGVVRWRGSKGLGFFLKDDGEYLFNSRSKRIAGNFSIEMKCKMYEAILF